MAVGAGRHQGVSGHRIVIAGAGIGGLTAALMLARIGCEVTVLEQAPELREIGAGLQISPNASRILDRLGILRDMAGETVEPEALNIRMARDGAALVRMPLGPSARVRWGAPLLVARRADAQRALLMALQGEARAQLMLGTALTGFGADADEVKISVRRGDLRLTLSADALIGADGLHSIVRGRLGSPQAPVFGGRAAYRALVPAEAAPAFARRPETNLWLGRQAHLVHYPVSGGRLVNVVAIVAETASAQQADNVFWDSSASRAPPTQYNSWSREARALLAAAPDWRRWPLFDVAALPQWNAGRVALLGDAAHAMLPFLAQGAAQAIEDAAALAAALAQPDVVDALSRYSAGRALRAARVQGESRRQGVIYHLAGPAAFARNLVLRGLGPERLMARYDWLYGHDAALC